MIRAFQKNDYATLRFAATPRCQVVRDRGTLREATGIPQR